GLPRRRLASLALPLLLARRRAPRGLGRFRGGGLGAALLLREARLGGSARGLLARRGPPRRLAPRRLALGRLLGRPPRARLALGAREGRPPPLRLFALLGLAPRLRLAPRRGLGLAPLLGLARRRLARSPPLLFLAPARRLERRALARRGALRFAP